MLVRLVLLAALEASCFQPARRVRSSSPRRRAEEFDNPNPLLKKAIDSVPTFAPGKRVVFGVLSEDVDAATVPAAAEQDARRAAAAAALTNIDDDERARRATVAAVGGLATLAYGAFLVATHASAVGRLTAFPLIALSFGYAESARAGL